MIPQIFFYVHRRFWDIHSRIQITSAQLTRLIRSTGSETKKYD